MAELWFLKIDGIQGESTHVQHQGEIDVLSWSWGVSQSQAGGGGGGGRTGKPTFQDFQFVTRISSASPKLLLACASGAHITTALLSGVRAGAKSTTPFLTYLLTEVMVGRVDHSDGEGDVPVEQFSLSYMKVEVAYQVQTETGQMGKPILFGYDLKKNGKV
ncbi:MAG: Hcp family type VI secretion system effector [Acidimicrobiia bacterium]